MNRKHVITLITSALLSVITTQAIANQETSFNPPFMQIGTQTSAPIGHAEFCKKTPIECQARFSTPAIVQLTKVRWKELLHVNASTNEAIKPITDMDLYNVVENWTYPEKAGDCEDYVLLKRRNLIRKGWPASALLITVVREANGQGHAVLTVRTDRGDLILDNQEGRILVWNQTPYSFVKRQSAFSEQEWVNVYDQRGVVNISQN